MIEIRYIRKLEPTLFSGAEVKEDLYKVIVQNGLMSLGFLCKYIWYT